MKNRFLGLGKLLMGSRKHAVIDGQVEERATEVAYPWAGIPYDPLGVSLESYSRHFPKKSLEEKRFYNIGAGTFRHQYWTNLDLSSDWYAPDQIGSGMIDFDLFSLEKFPIEDSSAEVAYTSHTVEHINNEAAQNMFNEAFRILKPGGVFRMTTPNIDLDLAAYRRNDRDYFYWIDLYSSDKVTERLEIKPFCTGSIQQIILFNFATHISELALNTDLAKVPDEEFDAAFSTMPDEKALDHFAGRCTIEAQRKRPGFHMNWWNHDKAFRMLTKAGFSTVYRSGYGQSLCPVLRDVNLFDKQDPKVSLYVEACKQ
jgi:SAM-dependent methyltransferase